MTWDEALKQGAYKDKQGRQWVMMDHDTWIRSSATSAAVANNNKMRALIEAEG